MTTIKIPTWYYQAFDADRLLDVPAEGYGGWKKADLDINTETTALVIMHAWDCGTWEKYPGWFRAIEYIPRSYKICETVFPKLLNAVRSTDMRLFHVVSTNDPYYKEYPGFKKTVELAGSEPISPERIQPDESYRKLLKFKQEYAQPGKHNIGDIQRGRPLVDFPSNAKPESDEPIAQNSHQLFALCKKYGINHLIYGGFAINGCLWTSPGGMVDMQRRGIICSAIRQAVTAIENKDTARTELAKEIALWQVASLYGFVYDVDDFTQSIQSK